MRCFRRRWDEDRGDEHSDWGGATYYFEVDEALMPTRQIEVYDLGPTLQYSRETPTGDYGFLSDQPLGSDDFAPFEIDQAVFEAAWQAGVEQRDGCEDFVFPEPWADLRGSTMDEQRQRRAMEEELAREVVPGHPLAGRSALAIARCQRCDDVLFGLDSGGYAVVHLTWIGQVPDRPPWPMSRWLASWAEVARYIEGHD